jgi:hypothetical protein
MSSIPDELFKVAETLEAEQSKLKTPDMVGGLASIEKAANEVGRAWSGSWLGYQSRVYYRDFAPPPQGARFSQEWGLMDYGDTTGDWVDYDYRQVIELIYRAAGDPDIDLIRGLFDEVNKSFQECREEVLSLLTTTLNEKNDSYLSRLKSEAERLAVTSPQGVAEYNQPKGQVIIRDMVAMNEGYRLAPHLAALYEVWATRGCVRTCEDLAGLARRAASHITKLERQARRSLEVGTNVFIGHGRSPLWRELKDFIKDKLGLPWDEFNRVPVAGVTNIERLSQMLRDAAIAFLIMTAEDEQKDGKAHARMNVVHEAGLFQGKLGFSKAVVLLEEGCEEFSNIHGLGQIRFPPGNIRAVFEDVRQVLEREGLIS